SLAEVLYLRHRLLPISTVDLAPTVLADISYFS
ncbi:MAG: hypothetical protein ACI9I0_001162, partial [Rhodoferax sp.]